MSNGAASTSMAQESPNPRNKTDKRRAANLLRDYYGLSSAGADSQSPSSTNNASASKSTLSNDSVVDKGLDLKELLQSNSLSRLLAKESELITEIRELDGERQSLVYNHHHELVSASDTIRNMKVKSESLDPSLDALKSSFEAMSNLASDLEVLRQPSVLTVKTDHDLDRLKDLEPIVTLPTTLADLIEYRLDTRDSARSAGDDDDLEKHRHGLAQAERLWGTMEPVLAAWTDAGVSGVREIAAECRSILKEGRKVVN